MKGGWKDDFITERQKFLMKQRKRMATEARNSGDDIETPELGNPTEPRKNYKSLLRADYQFGEPPFEPIIAEDIINQSGCYEVES